ncbi:BAG family molecular chaperone regulator 5 isoform X4 [Onychostoma macrolepis]|uniref:BAG family molecular chaperone regulator 5 isoform X3 n=1 Tax=Onychostoma macrolepis TaxID=369639 RepID=UPI00272D0B66|nr:BAG family molecular chaperone regulator 5 isoform X3 [Onychostoma macrolepis]XP_058651725.1 BAG family molecular chaperone regulator 5 isoform X4 [Onychostoma macrolepis]
MCANVFGALKSLFRKPFDGGKRTMDHGSQQQQTQQMPGPFAGYAGPQGPYPGQHPALLRLDEVQREIASLGPQVCSYSGLQNDREYKRLERELTRLLLEVDKVETEGRPELQQARKRAAGEVEGLLRYLEGNATHPSRLAIEELTQEAQNLLNEGVVEPFRQGQAQDAFEISEELVEAVQDVAMRLAQVKTGGSVPLRKARYKALTRVCAVQEILEGRVRTHTLALPLSDDTHEAVQRINQVMAQVSGARCQEVALLMGLSGRDSCAHLARILTELLVELDALDVSSNAAVRNYRKQVVEEINGLLKHLDLEGEGEDTRRWMHGGRQGYDLAQNDSIREIEVIRGRVSVLREEVLRHGAAGHGTELQGLLTHLDQVDTGRNPCIREARRRAVLEVQALITFLDLWEALGRRNPGPDEAPSHAAVWRVLASLCDLQAQVLGFDGKRADKSYMVLEELLTKQLLALDAVDPQGDQGTKTARKQAVKHAQNILSYLDMKTDEWEY